jgi:hypothetical protein
LPSQARKLVVRQLIDEPKPVYKVGFIREKGKVTLEQCSGAQKPVAPCSGEGWGFCGCFNSGLSEFFSLVMDSRALLGELVHFAPIGGRETILEHFAHQPCGRSVRPGISSSGGRNADFRIQE